MYVRMIGMIGAALLLSGAAHAQALGNYSGTLANGASISMTLTADPTTGAPQVTSMGISIQGNCKPSGTVNEGWGWNPGVDFIKGKLSYSTDTGYAYFYVKLTGTASGSTISGTISESTPIFAPWTKQPKSALFCSSGPQAYTLTYQGTTAAARPAQHVNFRD